MTRKYTAKDFANARFAEHPDKALAVNWGGGSEWAVFDNEGFSGHIDTQGLAEFGWVPVPSRPTITRSDYMLALGDRHSQYVFGFTDAMNKLDGEVIPDPEPTNTERLRDALASEGVYVSERMAERLDEAGITAPNVKDN